MKVRSDIKEFLSTIPSNVTVVAASKYVDANEMNKLLEAGICNFGENRVDSFLTKYEELKDRNIKWHFIGHLQRNKANKVINKIDYLHSLDSLELAKIIQEKCEKPLKTFVEVSINLEETKSGVPFNEATSFIRDILIYNNIELQGLMIMTIKASEHNSLEEQFSKLVKLRDEIEQELNIKLPNLSMGMSDDYIEAIEKGSTHIRLGRILFDEYHRY